MAAPAFDPVATVTDAASDLGTQLGGVAAIGLGVGVSIFALRKGWSLLRGFVG
jgi:hypothetical protein